MPKFNLTEESKIVDGVEVFRIQAAQTFSDVTTGDLGGFVERTNNLSDDGDCWIYDDAVALNTSIVYEGATLRNKAIACGNTRIYGTAVVKDHARIGGDGRVYDAGTVGGVARVYDTGRVYENGTLIERAKVYGNGKVYGDAVGYGSSEIFGESRLYGNAKAFGHCYISGDARVYGNAKAHGKAKCLGASRVYEDAEIFGLAKIYDNAEAKGKAKVKGRSKLTQNSVAQGSTTIFGNPVIAGDAVIEGKTYVSGRKVIKSDLRGFGRSYNSSKPKRDIPDSVPAPDPTPAPIWAGMQRAAIEGDSISAQSFSGSTTANSMGWINWLNAYMGYKFPVSISTPTQSFALGGGSLADMDADKEAQIGTTTAGVLFILGGANDIPSGASIATLSGYFDSITAYVRGTVGIPIVWLTIPPRTLNLGAPLTSSQLAVLKGFNEYIKSQEDVENGVIVVDIYGLMKDGSTDSPNQSMFANESGKFLHPNPIGAAVIGRAVADRLIALGVEALPEPVASDAENILTVGKLDGTGGVVSTNAAGVVPTGWQLSGFGGTQLRTGSQVADGYRILFEPNAGDGSSANWSLDTTADAALGSVVAGDEVVCYAVISTAAQCSRMDGPWLQVTEKNPSSNDVYYGMNKAGSGTGFFPAGQSRVMLHTCPITVRSGSTGFSVRLRCQAAADGSNTAVSDVTVHSIGIIKLSDLV